MTNFDEFWACYPGKKVARPKCKLKYDKLSDDEHKAVMLAIEAQSRYRVAAKKSGEFVAEWCNTQTFINQERWYDEIESHHELQQRAEAKICCIPDCQQPTIGNRFAVCEHHYQFDTAGRLRGNMKLVHELREHYAKHEEIHGLRGKEAINYVKQAIRGMLA